ncbi:MAG: PEP-CTERM sorting domain-containing protein [Planctomycetota bacterium]
MLRRSCVLVALVAVSLSQFSAQPPARAAIVATGDVLPTNPAGWTISTDAYIGKTANGRLTVDSGTSLWSDEAYIGYENDANGTVIIDGTGSTWTIGGFWFHIGHHGMGTLVIRNGANVSSRYCDLGQWSGSTGTVNIEGSDSTWTVTGSFGPRIGGAGNGVVNVLDGGKLITDGASVGGSASATGTVKVHGEGSAWTSASWLRVGSGGTGSLEISGRGTVNSELCTIGSTSDSTGLVAVDGVGSTLTNSSNLVIGDAGNGTLDIRGGGEVTVGSATYVARGTTGSGLIRFGAGGGTLTTKTLFVASTALEGTGTIHTRGLVTDINLVFDSAESLRGTIVLNNSPAQNVTVDLDLASDPATNEDLGVGWAGQGSLAIRNGVVVTSKAGYLGYKSGSSGTATIDGPGTLWNCGAMDVGRDGTGTLTISNGGAVTNTETFVAHGLGTGMVQFGPGGGTLTTKSLFALPSQFAGTGSVFARGLVSDVDLVVDTTESLKQSFAWNTLPAQDVTVNLDLTGLTSKKGALGFGLQAAGSLSVRNGVSLSSPDAYLGYSSGAVGTATVNGAGSIWTVTRDMHIGYNGTGSLSITAGGRVNCSGTPYGCYVGEGSGSIGTVAVSGPGSKLSCQGNTYIGHTGQGAIHVSDGGLLTTAHAWDVHLGYEKKSIGTVTIDGPGSKWTYYTNPVVGTYGTGVLQITHGGNVSCAVNYGEVSLGRYTGSKGTVIVDGPLSTWTSDLGVVVGVEGSGTFSITGGGIARLGSVIIGNSKSLLALDVGRGSSLVLNSGSGTLSNSGKVRLLASADIAPGTYQPILAGTWSGTGKYQAIGGTWNASTHEFIVGGVEQGLSGSPLSLDLASQQRALITCDRGGNGPDWIAGASFLAAATATPIEFTATAISGQMLTDLTAAMDAGESVLCGWEFSTTGYTVDANHPAYLSFDVGAGFSRDDFTVWHHDGTGWTELTPLDLTYDGEHYASFTVESFSGYAITAVPEPGTLALLTILGLAGLVVLQRRK